MAKVNSRGRQGIPHHWNMALSVVPKQNYTPNPPRDLLTILFWALTHRHYDLVGHPAFVL